MEQKTRLYSKHLAAKAKMVGFYGWSMPLHYGSQTQEHAQVRGCAGVFDVSHMMITDIHGPDRSVFLQYLLANDVARLRETGQALYSLMLNEAGGIIDDLIVYRMNGYYRIVTNAGTRARVAQWLDRQSQNFDIRIQPRDLSMLAIQGPSAQQVLSGILANQGSHLSALKKFTAQMINGWLVARTGYTGENGFEVMLEGEDGLKLWDALLDQGVQPCGLGARDTLRLEAGLNLYGVDMDEKTVPMACNLAWTLALDADRDFIGRSAVVFDAKDQVLIGLVMDKGPIPRAGSSVKSQNADAAQGLVTSGSFSPSLNKNIALARVQSPARECYEVQIRNRCWPVRVAALPFFKKVCSVD